MTLPTPPPCTLVIFGAAGDLTKRLLLPAIYNLATQKLLDPGFRIEGLDHNPGDDASWRAEITTTIRGFAGDVNSEFHGALDEATWKSVTDRMTYAVFDFTDAGAYAGLAQRLGATTNALFYLAVSPRFFQPIAEQLGAAKLLAPSSGTFRRIVIEKPFGHDLASARELNRSLLEVAREEQIYRIDHFLGKEAVQGILPLRFANGIYDAVLRREHVQSVQISALEIVGVEERGAFYEATGALRDMVPNHLLSVLTMLTMDAPESLEAAAVRDRKAHLMAAIQPVDPGDAVRGQYAAGTENGAAVAAYRSEHGVAPESTAETYAALKFTIDNARWKGVPFFVRTGKRLQRHVTTIAIRLRAATTLFGTDGASDVISLEIDPDQRLNQTLRAKMPGPAMELGAVQAGFRYDQFFTEPPNVGYETLLYHGMLGDQQLFQRADMIESGWAAIAPVLDAWSKNGDSLESYAAGSAGPAGADALLARNDDAWVMPQ